MKVKKVKKVKKINKFENQMMYYFKCFILLLSTMLMFSRSYSQDTTINVQLTDMKFLLQKFEESDFELNTLKRRKSTLENKKYKSPYGIDLCIDTIAVFSSAFRRKGANAIRFYIYKDTLSSTNHYNEFLSLFTNSDLSKIEVQFKQTFIFKYKNVLCITYYYSKDFAFLINRLTGDFPLCVLKVNKAASIEEKRFWNYK